VAAQSDSDSEDEADLLERLFGGNKPVGPVQEESNQDVEEEKEEVDEKPIIEIDDRKDEKDCVWHDEDDDQDAQKSVQTRFAELSSGWLKIKKIDQDEDTFAGKVLVNDNEALPEKTVDIEACGQLGIKNRTIMDLSFHHAAPVAALAQCDMVQLYQVDGRKNGRLQSIRLNKFRITKAQIISDSEILCTSRVPWFFTYDIVHGSIIRHNHISGYKKGQTITGNYYTSIESPYLAFPTLRGGINIVSKKYKDHVDTLQSGTNSCVDCHFSRDGNRVWSLADNGEVMCFDLRQMKAISSFNDMAGATSLCINHSETQFLVGSQSGMINIYDSSSCTGADAHPDPVKTLKNLRAPVTLQRFNRQDEMALFASSLVTGQTKLFHAKSNSMFGNFPGERKMGALQHAQFSPNSGFMGCSDGNVVRLFKLNHYTSY